MRAKQRLGDPSDSQGPVAHGRSSRPAQSTQGTRTRCRRRTRQTSSPLRRYPGYGDPIGSAHPRFAHGQIRTQNDEICRNTLVYLALEFPVRGCRHPARTVQASCARRFHRKQHAFVRPRQVPYSDTVREPREPIHTRPARQIPKPKNRDGLACLERRSLLGHLSTTVEPAPGLGRTAAPSARIPATSTTPTTMTVRGAKTAELGWQLCISESSVNRL